MYIYFKYNIKYFFKTMFHKKVKQLTVSGSGLYKLFEKIETVSGVT